MQMRKYIKRIQKCTKHGILYALVFGFVTSILAVGDVCLMPADHEVHAATTHQCPYTGPGTIATTTEDGQVSSAVPVEVGGTGKYYLATDSIGDYAVGKTFSLSVRRSFVTIPGVGMTYETQQPTITMKTKTMSCPVCGVGIAVVAVIASFVYDLARKSKHATVLYRGGIIAYGISCISSALVIFGVYLI